MSDDSNTITLTTGNEVHRAPSPVTDNITSHLSLFLPGCPVSRVRKQQHKQCVDEEFDRHHGYQVWRVPLFNNHWAEQNLVEIKLRNSAKCIATFNRLEKIILNVETILTWPCSGYTMKVKGETKDGSGN